MCFSNPFSKGTKHKGFTLVEIVITLLVISLLFVFLIAAMNMQAQKANETGVEVDMHSFYIAAKGAILSDIDKELTTKEAFIQELNGFLDPAMRIQNNGVYSGQDDPWNNPYEFRWRSREVNGKTEVWVAFLSKGVLLRDGWIFEPDSPNEAMYSRDVVDAETYPIIKEYRYITVLGYYPGGVMIPQMPDPANDVPWILGEDVVIEEVDQWAYLQFEIEAEGIELDTTVLDENQKVAKLTDEDEGNYGTNGVYQNTPTGGYLQYSGSEGSLGKGSYLFVENMGSGYSGGGLTSVASGSIGYARYETLGALPEEAAGSDEAIDSWLAGNGWTRTNEEETIDGEKYYNVYISLGYGNQIKLTFKESDKRADSTWFKVGSTVTLKAIPGSNYDFEYWKVNGTKYSEEKTISIVVESDTTFTAKFRADLDVSGGKLVLGDGSDLNNTITSEEAAKEAIINADAASKWDYTVIDGKATLTGYKGLTGSSVNLTIPAVIDGYPVEAINMESGYPDSVAFNTVTIPDGVSITGGYLLKDCTVSNVIIGDNVNSVGRIFYGTSIEDLVIGKGFTGIDEDDTKEPIEGATVISVRTSTLPENTSTGNTIGLGKTLVNFTQTADVTEIDNLVFKDFTNLKTVTCEGSITSIGENAFYGCEALTEFKVNGTIGKIDANAFYGCGALVINENNLNLINCTSIGQQAFHSIGGINGNLVFADNTTIGASAFQNVAGSVDRITVGAGSTIGKLAFNSAQLSVKDIVIGNSCTFATGGGQFYDVDITGTITLGSDCIMVGSEFNASTAGTTSTISKVTICENIEMGTRILANRIVTDVIVKEGVTLGNDTFYGCTITNLDIGENVTTSGSSSKYGILGQTGTVETLTINSNPGKYAFRGSTSVNIKNLVIGEKVDTIVTYAFQNCRMESIYLGESVRTIEANAFQNCQSYVTKVEINNVEGCLSDDTLDTYIAVKTGNSAITNCADTTYLK